MGAFYAIRHFLYSNLFVTLPYPTTDRALSNAIYIVTGGNSGLGLEVSRHLLRLGVNRVIITVRDLKKGNAARSDLLRSSGRDDTAVDVWYLDMNSYDSVREFADRVNGLPRLDGVCANAGLATTEFRRSEGIEQMLNVNVVSTFLMYFLLLPKMREHERRTGLPATFTIPNSILYDMAPRHELHPPQNILARLSDEKSADMGGRYPLSKLLVIWIVRELAVQGKNLPITNTPNPSFCATGLMRETDGLAVRIFTRLTARSAEMGSRALVHGMLYGAESHGQFMDNCHTVM
jgi:NAD(P)-dependent dehydrogenase (short-subunit alcohol dehydrogenase family)